MYICICKGITQKQLEEKVIAHQGNTKQILNNLGVGTDCGTCLQEAINLIKKNHHNFKQSKPSQKR